MVQVVVVINFNFKVIQLFQFIVVKYVDYMVFDHFKNSLL